jgi:uncharacterized membrane protein YccC
LNPELLRKSLKLALAGFITAGVAAHFNRIEFAWYPLLAVVMVVDDNDENTLKAARARTLGTLVGGLVTFLVHTTLEGWMGVMVSILLMVPVLRALGWEAGLSTAALVSVMFLMLPAHERMNWNYVFNRALDTSVGCASAVGVGLLFWPRNRLRELARAETLQLKRFGTQVAAYQHWILNGGPRPSPLQPACLSSTLAQMEQWVQMEQAGSSRQELQRQRWRQRLLVWRSLVHHWVQWERLLADAAAADALRASLHRMEQLIQGQKPSVWRQGSDPWLQAAEAAERPLPLLAIASELHPLLAALGTIQLMRQKPT